MKRCVASQRSQRDAGILVNVAFPNLDEATELGQTRKTHWNRFASKRVEHHVYSAAIGKFHHRLGKVAASGIDHMFHAECFEQGALRGTAGAGDDFGTEMMCNLNCGHADAAGTGVNQHPLSLAQSRHIFQRMPGSHEHHR